MIDRSSEDCRLSVILIQAVTSIICVFLLLEGEMRDILDPRVRSR